MTRSYDNLDYIELYNNSYLGGLSISDAISLFS